MKKALLICMGLAGAVLFTGCNNQQSSSASGATNGSANATNAETASANTNALSTEKDRESYAYGMYMGSGWKKNGVDIDVAVFAQAAKDVQSGKPTLLDEEQMRTAMMQLQRSVMANRQKMQSQ
ncbi:MAG: FKBP-type peptidyl-prolyl cis-trans isomerase N-terminal domain-containing protein, partial [Limisphaerales bacterium]